MSSPESVVLIVSAILFWTLIVAVPLMVIRRIGDLRRRVETLEVELRQLAARAR